MSSSAPKTNSGSPTRTLFGYLNRPVKAPAKIGRKKWLRRSRKQFASEPRKWSWLDTETQAVGPHVLADVANTPIQELLDIVDKVPNIVISEPSRRFAKTLLAYTHSVLSGLAK